MEAATAIDVEDDDLVEKIMSTSNDNDTDSVLSESDVSFHDCDEDSWKFSDKELWDIARRIGSDWRDIGITLGYQITTMQMLDAIYEKEPVFRNYLMLEKWCRTVSHLELNPKVQLASHLSTAGRVDLAQYIQEYYADARTPKNIYHHIKNITFDRDNIVSKETIVTNYFQFLSIGGQNEMSATKPCLYTEQRIPIELDLTDDNILTKINEDKSKQTEQLLTNQRESELHKLVLNLCLGKYFPGKICLQDVRLVKSPKLLLSLKLIPWQVLDRIIMLNYKAREEDLCIFYDKTGEDPVLNSDDSDEDIFDDSSSKKRINPLDLFLVIFLSCDLPLKQEILSKLFTCRLAFPVMYRDHKNSIILSNWAMKQIVISKHVHENTCYADALNCDAKRVSFIRVGEPSLSKSRLLNEVLSDQNHPTFYNRDCPLGASRRVIANGIVEGAWFMPSGRPNDVFNEIIMFMNLRGDSLCHTDELYTLCELSDVVVAHVKIEFLQTKSTRDLFLQLHKRNIFVVYALESSDKPNIQPRQVLKEYKKFMDQFKENMKFLNLQSTQSGLRSASDKTKELRKSITEALSSRCPSSLQQQLKKKSFLTDEISPMCKARDLMNKIDKKSGLQKKLSVLPLQGEVWQDFCRVTKTWNRSKSNGERRQLEADMEILRGKQRIMYQNGCHKFIDLFNEHLRILKDSPVFMNVYISWITSEMNEESRNILPRLRKVYKDNWLNMKRAKERNETVEYNYHRNLVDESEIELVAASFGIEHIIRELGQIYEALASAPLLEYGYQTTIDEYARFASMLLRLGYPFEIMDGDTAMVPLTWVKAVFRQLQKDIGNKKLLAISVLGIQSSGKSTLLNTMFGLKFPVSAGRCTRGVYVQLVPVSKGVLPFSYVIVIDTEGLRAPELADEKYSHDNELATFVLGLGNITIINVKGENTSEIENVLQIAVHAFLRLKLANGRLKLQQTCIFAHQNVPAEDASSAMIHARQKMLDKLDKMTTEAANKEGIAHITSFNQVIDIDSQSHMWYFSDLFYGDPPMSPINLGYSEKVAEVKNHILFDIALKEKTFLTITDTVQRIEDLWNGILSDDFVYSFRNSLEMKAYYSLELKYNKLTWEIEKKTFDLIRQTASVKLARCAALEELNNETMALKTTLKQEIIDSQLLCIEQWNNFIDNCSLKEIMEQWRENRLIKLNEFVLSLEQKAYKNVEKKVRQAKADLVRTKKRKTHELEVKKRASSLAAKCKEKFLLTIDVMRKNFNEMWKALVGELEHEVDTEDKPVKDQIEDILYETFVSDRPYISKELKTVVHKETQLVGHLPTIQGTFSCDQIKEGDISFHQNILTPNAHQLLISQAMEVIHVTLAKIDSYISNIMCQDVPFEQTYATGVFGILADSIDLHNNGFGALTNFKFTAAFKVKLAVHIFHHITNVFTGLDKRYQAMHNTVAQMNDYRNLIWQQFTDTVKNERDSIKISNILLSTVEKLVVDIINDSLPNEVLKMVIDECFSTKYSFMLAMMKDLAEKEDFKRFHWYITDAESFAREWVTEFTKNKLFTSSRRLESGFMSIIQTLIKNYIKVINHSLDVASSTVAANRIRQNDIKSWTRRFEMTLGKYLPIPYDIFQVYEFSCIVDYKVVHSHFKEQLTNLEKRLRKRFASLTAENVVWKESNPYILIFNHLWGCNQTCPFCRETCHRSLKCHQRENHACIQHRPPGLKGVREEHTNLMSWETCNYCVYSDNSFYCGVSDRKCQSYGNCNAKGATGSIHYFKDYSKLTPDWEIEPSSLMESSTYWMWFTYTFRKQLAQTFGYIIPEIVGSWKNISKRKAINSLKQRGHLTFTKRTC